MKKIRNALITTFKWFFGILGILLLIFVVLSFTDIPYYAYYRLGTSHAKNITKPDYIIVMGGSGMPSPEGLIRCYYAAEAAIQFKEAKIIIALPSQMTDSLKQIKLMSKELIIRGVDSLRIIYETKGFNTHSQVENIKELITGENNEILLITSPEHMYRSAKTFQKAGFLKVNGTAAFEKPVDEILLKDKDKSTKLQVKSPAFRYNMWSYMNYELLVLREYSAIFYYKIKGWI